MFVFMKKVVWILSLLVLLITEIVTPITYASEFWEESWMDANVFVESGWWDGVWEEAISDWDASNLEVNEIDSNGNSAQDEDNNDDSIEWQTTNELWIVVEEEWDSACEVLKDGTCSEVLEEEWNLIEDEQSWDIQEVWDEQVEEKEVEEWNDDWLETEDSVENWEILQAEASEVLEEVNLNIIDNFLETVSQIVNYFFKKENNEYIKYASYGWTGIISLVDPENGSVITMLDANLWAESDDYENEVSYGNYYQWGSAYWFKDLAEDDLTTRWALYSEKYAGKWYSRDTKFRIWNNDIWEVDEETSKSSYDELWYDWEHGEVQWVCPDGYHVPSLSEWKKVVSTWIKIHTQDTVVEEENENMEIRSSINSSFKNSLTSCEKGDMDENCIEEENFSEVMKLFQKELNLPLAGSYSQDGAYVEGAGVYWTTTPWDLSYQSQVFDIHSYFWGDWIGVAMNRAEGHSLRCFMDTFEKGNSDSLEDDVIYNSEEIVWEEEYNGVTVKVVAPVGSFPEGTELDIEPVRLWNLRSLKNQLVEEQEEIKEDTTIVAFDIVFMYEWEERQPKEWKTVNVTFDYNNNEKLLKADKSEEQELKVYHIEDKDEKWNKVEKWEEKIEQIAINEEKTEDITNGLVVEAESFSTYVLVVVDSTPTITIYGSWWVISESSIISFNCEDFVCTWTISPDDGVITLPTITKENAVFLWWVWTDLTTMTKSVSIDASDVTSDRWYRAKWTCDYGYIEDWDECVVLTDSDEGISYDEESQTITVWWSWMKYTIQDRNVGATSTWTWNNKPASSRWKYFQWWNNYGIYYWDKNFIYVNERLDVGDVNPSTYSWPIVLIENADSYNPYVSTNGTWYQNLWWDYSAINDWVARRWPCPEWYHVPSMDEYEFLHNLYPDYQSFSDNLYFPPVWWLTNNKTKTSVSLFKDWQWKYASSTNWGDANIRYYSIHSNSVYHGLTQYIGKSNLLPVRCFQNYANCTSTQHKDWLYCYDNEIQISCWDVENWTWMWTGVWNGSSYDEVCNASDVVCDDWYVFELDGPSCLNSKNEDWSINYDIWPYEEKQVDLLVSWSNNKIRILDRNLWAMSSGTGMDSYGFYYQWWNNYWFMSWDIETENGQVDAGEYWPWNYYLSSAFIKWVDWSYWNWDISNNENLWWWAYLSSWDNVRQWPCPEWYHIPTKKEWDTTMSLFSTWFSSSLWSSYCDWLSKASCFSEIFSFPFAGYRFRTNWTKRDVGVYYEYWASDSYSEDNWYRMFSNDTNGPYGGNSQKTYGYSIRCFKDTTSKKLSFVSSWDLETELETTVRWREDGETLPLPVYTWYFFEWWYTTSWYEDWTRVTTNAIADYTDDEEIILYGKFRKQKERTVTYDVNGWYFPWDKEETKELVYKESDTNSWYYLIWTTDWKTPSKTGFMFDWWYLTWLTTRWTWAIQEDMTVYAKWLPFEDLDVRLSDDITVTIMDRNLWAISAGTWCSDSDTSACWYHFQWWNNYWFAYTWAGTFFPNWEEVSAERATDWQDSISTYYRSIYVSKRDWYTPMDKYDNLRWWNDWKNTSDTIRQWPCPDGYHVPTSAEWGKLGNLLNISSWDQLRDALNLPYAGVRSDYGASVFDVWSTARYQSSTPSVYGGTYWSSVLNFTSDTIQWSDIKSWRWTASSVRCFKNTEKKVLRFESKWGTELESIQSVRWWETVTILPQPSRWNSIFLWWYTTSWYEEGTEVTTTYINTEDEELTLYAKWECEEWYEESLDWRSCLIIWHDITYDAWSHSWTVDGESVITQRMSYWTEIALTWANAKQAESDNWYDFIWWTTELWGTETIDSYTVKGDMTFYAVFKKDASVYDVNFYNNGASLSLWNYSESTVVPEIHEWEYIRYTCWTPELWNNDSYPSCKVKIPTIVRDWFEIKGFSGNAWILQPWGYTFFYEGDDFYAQTSKTITATFNANGNPWLLSWEEVFSSITKECSIENTASSCEITSPEIQTGTTTPEVIWFSNGATSYENVWTPWTTSSLMISNTYYAQTKAEHTFNVTYTKAESWIASIWADADSCDTVYYNEQTSSCSITLPSITLDEWYESAVWKKDGVSYTPGTELWISWDESFVADARLSSYTITFNTDWGSAVDAITQAYWTSIERPDDPSKEWYTFSWWDIEIPETMPAENLTITALWTINSHLFALNSADGIEIEAWATAPWDYYDYATEIVFTWVVLPGYTFLSWSGLPANASYSNSWLTVRFSMPDEDVIVTPILWENDYTVVFHKQADDALWEMEDLYLRYNERNYLPGNLFGRTGYNFLGWSRAENSDEIDYEDWAYINEAVLESWAIVDLYAVWTGIHYSILFDGNSDEAAGYTAPIYDVLYDDEVSLSENGYERNGYNFLGWSMNAWDSDPSYSDQQTVSWLTAEDESYITLYAIWWGRWFYVDFDKNAEDAVWEMETQRFIYGTSQSLRKNTFTRPWYTFLWWSEYAWDVEAEYEDEAEGSMLTTNENSTVDLYAVWHANEDTPYYVNYYLQNIEDDDYTLSWITIEKTWATDSIISVNDLVENYAGFDFLEARDSEGNIIEYTNLDWDESTVINLYYDRVVHSVSLATNRWTSNVSWEGNYRYWASVVVNVDVNDWYEWNAWRAWDASVVSNEKNYSFIMGEDDVSLEAYAQAIDYAISYVLRWGENNVDNPESYTVEDVVTLYNPSKEGYEFMWWTLSWVVMEPEIGYTFSYETWDKLFIAHWNAEDVGIRVEHYTQDLDEEEYTLVSWITESGIADDEIGDRTREWEWFEEADWEKTVILNGTWENNEYINPDGGTVIQYYYPRASYVLSLMEGQWVASVYWAWSYKYEEPVEISAVVRDWYSFVGFYSWEELHDEAFSMPAYPLSLDAVASANHYVVHFDGGDAALWVMEDQEFVYDIEDTLNENSYERVGYSFVWRRDKVNDAVYADYADWEAVKNLVTSWEITLSALWQVNSYSLTLYKNDWSDEYATEYFVYDETWSVITSYERNGYLFVWWNTDEYWAGEEKDVSSVYQWLSESWANLNLYAQREIIPYSIEYFWLEGIDEELNNPTYYDVESWVIVLENPSKNGYGFLGWSWTDIDGLSKNVIIPEQSTGNRIYEANFKENTYTLYLSAAWWVFENWEEWYEEEIEYLKPVTVPEPTRNWYEFAWWDIEIPESMPASDMYAVAEWNIIPYTIQYELHWGALADGEENPESYTVEDVVALYNPSKEGYTFIWWSWTDIDWVSDDVVVWTWSTGNRSYEANFKENTYTLYLSAAWWVFENWEEWYEEEIEYLQPVTVPEPTRNWYEFAWWNVEIPESMPASDVYAVAEWNIIPYTIQYELHWGALADGEENPEEYDVESWRIVLYNPKKEGYTFIWWSWTDIDGVSDAVVVWAWSTGNRSYEANWNENSYIIRLHENNGSEEYYDREVLYTEEYIVPQNWFEKVWYSFSWWNARSGWDAEWYEIGTIISWMRTENAEVFDLYAIWDINQYTLSFDTDWGTEIEDITQDYDTEITAPENPSKTWYTFAWWDIPMPLRMPAEDLKLTAQWEVNVLAIVFDTDGWTPISTITWDYWTVVTRPDDPIKTGYTFNWWIPEIPETIPEETVTVKAQWSANTYEVVFDANWGEGEMENQAFVYDEGSKTLTENAFSRLGYEFVWWNTEGDWSWTGYHDKQEAQNLTAVSWAVVTLYAQWSVVPYSIIYHLAWGTWEVAWVYSVETETFELPTVEKTWYTFMGWTGTDLDGVVRNVVIEKGSVWNREYTAQWEANIYIVEFRNDEESAQQMFIYDEEQALDVNSFVKTWYSFSWWISWIRRFDDWEVVKNLTIGSWDTVVLHAEWNANTYIVSFDGNWGSWSMGDQEFVYDVAQKLRENAFELSWYAFSGWIDENEMRYGNNEEVKNLATWWTVVLSAEWNKLYQLVIKDGETVLFSWMLIAWEKIVLPAVPTKTGYKFVRWVGLPADGLMSDWDLVITIEWEKTSSDESWSSARAWGWGGRRIVIDSWANEEHSSAELTWNDNILTWWTKEEKEVLNAYEWAYHYWITTIGSEEAANANWFVKRGHLAKMLVNYVVNVLGKEVPSIPEECQTWNDDASEWESDEIRRYAEQACALWIMGIDTFEHKFYPNQLVSRAQFGTTLSRILYGDTYQGGAPYYERHLRALQEEGVMMEIDHAEERLEYRKWIWVMLRRTKEREKDEENEGSE